MMAGATPANAPDVSRSHTAFRLRWPEGRDHGLARFDPLSSGLHVFYLGGMVSLTLTGLPSGRLVEATSSESSGCAAMPDAVVVDLENDESYLLSLQSVSVASGLLVIEALDPERSCAAPSSSCRSSGPCTKDEECCLFCHDGDHCH
jgi:hypothetical protein